jgi:5-methyltetrahydrofolate--homocysteine methyltransferase
MDSLLKRLERGDVIVGDGAWGTMLMARGLPAGQPPEWFALEKPDVLTQVATLYLEAGAEIVTTDTFGASSLRLEAHGLAGEVARINREAVLAVRRAVGDHALVSASVGPTGRLLEPVGDVRLEEVKASFAEQIRALAEAGADIICVETMTDLAEAVAAVEAAREVAPNTPVIATMTFQRTPRGFFTMMGTSIAKAAAGLEAAGAHVVGSNCGQGTAEMIAIAAELGRQTGLPLAIRPNAGLPEQRDGELHFPESPEALAAGAVELLDRGVRIVGGCCGTSPEHVRAIRKAVDAHRQRA